MVDQRNATRSETLNLPPLASPAHNAASLPYHPPAHTPVSTYDAVCAHAMQWRMHITACIYISSYTLSYAVIRIIIVRTIMYVFYVWCTCFVSHFVYDVRVLCHILCMMYVFCVWCTYFVYAYTAPVNLSISASSSETAKQGDDFGPLPCYICTFANLVPF